MNKTIRIVVPGIAAAAMAASLAACGSSTSGNGGSGSGTNLTAGGSSAQKDAQGAWTNGFNGGNVTYDGSQSSGIGKSKFTSGEYAFGGSDSALKEDAATNTHELSKATAHCGGIAPLEIPVYISPIAVVFNVPGVTSLKLDAATIAKIFALKITTWNDPAIKALNPSMAASLPSLPIQVAHRSTSSGTTNNFTDYLYKAAPAVWTTAASSDWPTSLANSGLKAPATSDMKQAITGTSGAIGYIDASKDAGMGIVSVAVGGGYTAPSAAGAASDFADSSLKDPTKTTELIYSVDRTPTKAASYPITLVSYVIACQDYSKTSPAAASGTGAAVKAYLEYITSTAGQTTGSDAAKSAPLPSAIQTRVAAVVATIK